MSFDFENLQKTIASIGALIATKKSQREQLAEERDRIAALPYCRADLIAAYDDWIQKSAGFYKKQLLESATVFCRHPDRGLPPPVAHVDRLGLLARRDKDAPSLIALFGLLEPVLRERVAELLKDLPINDEAGLPLAERSQKMSDLDSRIEALDADIQRIEEQAVRAGLISTRRQPTPEELNQAFGSCYPTNPAAYAHAVENLTRRLNGLPPLPPEPLPAAPVRLVQEPEFPK